MTRWNRLTKEQAKKLGIDEGTWELMHIEEEETESYYDKAKKQDEGDLNAEESGA